MEKQEASLGTFWISKSVLAWLLPGAPAFLDHSAVVVSANSISITRFMVQLVHGPRGTKLL